MDALSDLEQSISQADLDAIEVALDSAPPLIKRRNKNSTLGPAKTRRRLPSWGSQQSPTLDQSSVSKSEAEINSNSESENNSTSIDSGSNFCPKNQSLSPQVDIKANYPSIKFGGHIVYCTTVSEVEKATAELLKLVEAKQNNVDQITPGFDTEWRPTFRRGEVQRKAAVMQICGDTSHCYVLHVIHSGIPPILQSLLEDPKYVKVGFGIAGDANKVLKDYNISIKSLEDLSWLANQKLDGFTKRRSLASLTEMLTCKQLEEPKKIRLGNWEVKVLSKDQLHYAAADAFVSWHLYQILKSFPDLPRNQNEEKVDGLQS